MKQVVITLLLFATLPDLTLLFAQAKPSTNSPPNGDQSLKMTKIGEGYMFGRHAAFRTYETPDHTEALVWYGEFRSEEESKLATELSLKEHRITAMQVDALIETPPPLAAFAENSSSCDRSSELLSKQQQLSEEEPKRVHQVRGMVAIVINADGDVVGAKAISASRPRHGNDAGLSSAEAVDVLLSQARSMKFKSRLGCGDFRYAVSF